MKQTKELFCTLTRHYITDEGDFIPKGTPVQVLQWNQKDSTLIDVRTSVYMYTGFTEDLSNSSGFIHEGLYIEVKPEDLEYGFHNIRQDWSK